MAGVVVKVKEVMMMIEYKFFFSVHWLVCLSRP